MEIRQLRDLQEEFLESYEAIKGSAYNNCLTFTAQLVGAVVKLVRSYQRFQNTVLVGPSGCGKRAAVTFFAHHMELNLVECASDGVDDFRAELFRAASEAITGDSQVMVSVVVGDAQRAEQVFDLVDRLMYYGDLPGMFTEEEKMSQLYGGDRVAEFEAMCDTSRHKERVEDKVLRLRDNLHVIVDLSPPVFEACYPRFPNLFAKSGIIAFREWSKPMLEAIARERLSARLTHAKGEFPLEAVCKTFASLHLHQQQHDSSGTASTQFLDVVALFPEIYTPLQKKLLDTETSLKAGIQCVVRSNGFIKQLTEEVAVKEPEIQRLASEIEQLNKRLTHERINLDKASKAFRRKEVAARKKSEETQELAADAHRY